MDLRSFMRKGEKITLIEETTGNKKTFTIIAKDGAGSSSASYIVSCGRKTGRLKEFYPAEENGGALFSLVRGKDNQLYPSNPHSDAAAAFSARVDEYIESYYILDDAKKRAENGADSFSSFIPSFEVFRGCDRDGERGGSAYVWTIDSSGDFETFRAYLDKVHKHPSKNSAKALYIILKALYNLTESVKMLHSAGLIHSDLKPENIGFSIRDGRYLTEQMQLFDVNSIYSVYTKYPVLTGTIGYCAPEVHKGKVTTQSDLYSIGAILFNAIATGQDGQALLYSDKYYNAIDEIIASSKLIMASPITANIKFRTAISNILKKCLAKDLRKRVDNCDELKSDLRAACVFLIPAEYNDSLELGCELKIIDKEMERFSDADSLFALQSLLFNHPLYQNADDTIRVLIAGFGVYGQQFLDVCLQAGQVRGKKLEITVVTKDKQVYKTEYLQSRPALIDFFEIDGEGDCSEDNYGKIFFLSPQEAFDNSADAERFSQGFSKTDVKYNKELISALMCANCKTSYAFISLGEDALNLSVAKACAEVVSILELRCTVACVCKRQTRHKGFLTVDVTASAKQNKNYQDIERFAFNAHLCYSDPLVMNINPDKIKKQFADKYYHNASVACVLAIKNYLHACGIELGDLSSKSILKAAREYKKFINNNKDIFAELVCIEHKRWVIDKLTDGWTLQEDLSECLVGPVNDKRKKKHPCIVKSGADFNLEKYYTDASGRKWLRDKWDRPCEQDALLDGLDRVAINLHRVFFNAAEQVRRSYSVEGEEAARISWIISEHKDAVIAFNDWMLCLKRAWNKDETQAKLYEGYKDDFIETLGVLSVSEREEVIRYVDFIDAKARPIILAYKMRYYKKSDKDMVGAIPFILTNCENRKLFIPLMTGDNTARFNNVASATLINPESITYGVYLKKQSETAEVFEVVESILSYMDKRDIKSKIKIALIYCDKAVRQSIEDTIYKLENTDARIARVIDIPICREAELSRELTKKVSADAYEHNDTYLAALLTGAGFYKNKPSYRFDSANKSFTTNQACEWLGYIKSKHFVTVSDMLSFMNSTGFMESVPEYKDYQDLWQYYSGISYAWKDMCRLLETYAEKNDLVSSFIISTDLENAKTLEYIIPTELRDGCSYILCYLRDRAKVIGENSGIEYNTTESCRVKIVVGQNNVGAVKKLFANPYMLANQRDIDIRTKPKKVEILFNDLVVREIKIDDFPEFSEKKKKIGEILATLQSKGYIYNLKNCENQSFSFVYSTRQSKQLMTNAGRILEIYVYHKLQESGFDDVVSGYEINWGDSDVKSEIDCIVVSGFKSAIVECKAQDKISQEYYHKLFSLTRQFGINAVPVLISDTHEQQTRLNANNQMQRKRGDMMDIITVFNRDDITNIDTTLRRIFNGKY